MPSIIQARQYAETIRVPYSTLIKDTEAAVERVSNLYAADYPTPSRNERSRWAEAIDRVGLDALSGLALFVAAAIVRGHS